VVDGQSGAGGVGRVHFGRAAQVGPAEKTGERYQCVEAHDPGWRPGWLRRRRHAGAVFLKFFVRDQAAMDKRDKKRIDVLNQKLQKLRQQLSGARRQTDEPDEVVRLEKQVVEVEAELQKLKG
jgi:hypothetical protein